MTLENQGVGNLGDSREIPWGWVVFKRAGGPGCRLRTRGFTGFEAFFAEGKLKYLLGGAI